MIRASSPERCHPRNGRPMDPPPDWAPAAAVSPEGPRAAWRARLELEKAVPRRAPGAHHRFAVVARQPGAARFPAELRAFAAARVWPRSRSEEHTSELQSHSFISYA